MLHCLVLLQVFVGMDSFFFYDPGFYKYGTLPLALYQQLVANSVGVQMHLLHETMVEGNEQLVANSVGVQMHLLHETIEGSNFR